MNKDKRNNIQLLGTLNNADESGIIANANQVYDANEDKSTQDVSKEHKERIETLETKESSMQTTLENITKTGEASAASNVTYNHNDSKLDSTNVQKAIDEIYSKSNYNNGDEIIPFNTVNYIENDIAYILLCVSDNFRPIIVISSDNFIPYYSNTVSPIIQNAINSAIDNIKKSNNNNTIDTIDDIVAFLKNYTTNDSLKDVINDATKYKQEENDNEYIFNFTDSSYREAFGVKKDLIFEIINGLYIKDADVLFSSEKSKSHDILLVSSNFRKITDENYNDIKTLVTTLNTELNNKETNLLSGKVFTTIGDSLCASQQWQTHFAKISNTKFIGGYDRGGETTLGSGDVGNNGINTGNQERAVKLVNEHPNVDIIFIENINDGNTLNIGKNTDIAFMHLLSYNSKVLYNSYTDAVNAFNSVISDFTPALGAAINMRYLTTNGYKLSLNIDNIANGTLTIKIGVNSYPIEILKTDTISTILDKIVNWDYSNSNYIRTKDNNNVIFTYNNAWSEHNQITVDAGNTNIIVTIENINIETHYCMYFNSNNLNNWNDITYWKNRKQITLWSIYKGLFHYLLANFPKSKIYLCIFPRVPANHQVDYDEYDEALISEVTQRSLQNFQKEFAYYYYIPCIDVAHTWGITCVNSLAYYPKNNVHPLDVGYNEIAKTIYKLIK